MILLDTSQIQPAYLEEYQNLVLRNHDIFSVDKFDLGQASHYHHVIHPVKGAATTEKP